jgi:hypothetical protein
VGSTAPRMCPLVYFGLLKTEGIAHHQEDSFPGEGSLQGGTKEGSMGDDHAASQPAAVRTRIPLERRRLNVRIVSPGLAK